MTGKARNRGIRSKWTKEDLQNAVAAVKEGGMSRQGASKTFSIPRRTLSRYVDKNENKKSAMGRKPVLTADQERTVFKNNSTGRGWLPAYIEDTSKVCVQFQCRKWYTK